MHKFTNAKLMSFSAARYTSFFILMLRGFMVASILGKEAFGLYSLVIILQQQFSLFGLGVRESVCLKLMDYSRDDQRFLDISIAALCFSLLVIGVLTLISWILFHFDVILGYQTYNIHMALMLASFTIGTEILSNVTRTRGMLGAVMIGEFAYATISFTAFWFVSRSFALSDNFLYTLLATNVVVFCYYVFMNKDLFSNASFFFTDLSRLVVLGIPILIQNVCTILLYSAGHYYLILSEAVEQLSIYSFAFSLVIAAQVGARAVLWAKFSEMLILFGTNDESGPSKKKVAVLLARISAVSQTYLVLSIIALKLFLSAFVFQFFPEFVLSVPLVVIIFMALYWPILAVSEATLLLSRKLFGMLYISSGVGLLALGLLLFIYGQHSEALGTFELATVTAFLICVANFIFYCMLKLNGGNVLGHSLSRTLFDIIKNLGLVCILVGFYYNKELLLPVFAMVIIVLFMERKFLFKSKKLFGS